MPVLSTGNCWYSLLEQCHQLFLAPTDSDYLKHYFVSERFQLFDVPANYFAVAQIHKIIDSKILVRLPGLQYMVDDDRNGMRNGYGSAVFPPAGGNTVVLLL